MKILISTTLLVFLFSLGSVNAQAQSTAKCSPAECAELVKQGKCTPAQVKKCLETGSCVLPKKSCSVASNKAGKSSCCIGKNSNTMAVAETLASPFLIRNQKFLAALVKPKKYVVAMK